MSKYNNYGNVGAMGDYASANGVYFGSERSSLNITKENIEVLKEFSDKLAMYKSEDVKPSQMRNASSIIDEIIENSDDGNESAKIEAISKWKKFTKECVPAVMSAIRLVSEGIKNINDIKELLGI